MENRRWIRSSKRGPRLSLWALPLPLDQIRDLAKECELDIKAVHFKEIISEHMVIPEEMIPKDDDEEAIEPAVSE